MTDGRGTGVGTAPTARTGDGRLSVTYVPSTGTDSRALAVDFGRFPGPVAARWYNPADGRFTAIGDVPHPNRRTHAFRTLGDNGAKANDWLLILEVRWRGVGPDR